ncbi:MAG: rhomboid family intramembrane serine protease [Rhodobacteraceae bacterium]|jgi:membrane associated rhomboid family serine protease|nr:rhomboid family intramembrane serine protease [Paracoccaceae bacterium]
MFFPFRDHNPSGRTPFVCWLLILANVLIFLGYWLTLPNDRAIGIFFYEWGLVPRFVMAGEQGHTIITSMFLHGGWMHIIGNMLFLWVFGDNLEDQMGHFTFLGFYLASGVAAAGLQIAADPQSIVPMVGASGAIAGVLGGYLLLFPKARVDVLIFFVIFIRVIPIPAWIVLGLWFAMQVFSGFATPTEGGGVAYWAHAGGFIAGVVLALPFWLRRGGPGFWNKTHGMPPHPEAEYQITRSRIPVVRRMR